MASETAFPHAPICAPSRQCVILVGGLGTRLGDLTGAMPKPLLPVAGRPFLDILVAEAARRGFRHFLFLAGHAAREVQSFADTLAVRHGPDFRFDLSIEPEPLGTGGALIHALPLLEPHFLLLNGDTWCDFNWLDLLLHAQATGGSMAAVREVPVADRYESFDLDAAGLVSGIIPRGTRPGPALINAGVYALQKADLAGFSGTFSLEDMILPRLVKQRRLGALRQDGFFIDIGIPATYETGQQSIPARLRRGALFLDRDGVINHDDNYVHRPDQVRWMDGAIAAIKRANDAGLYVFVVTNQAGVARGYYPETAVQNLHDWMADTLRSNGASVDDWRYCPYHPEGTVDRYRGLHDWRKPGPGMLLDLIRHWPIDTAHSLMIGDQPTDMAAAEAAGVPGARFIGGDLDSFLAGRIPALATA
jgi:D,D-heptose 1,7-bisphosphate phosphatase